MDGYESSLAGKTAIVTGSTSGIRFGIAGTFTDAGMHIMCNGRGGKSRLQKIGAELEERCGVKTACSAADMAKPDEIVRTVEEARATFGELDVLVNNSGTSMCVATQQIGALSLFLCSDAAITGTTLPSEVGWTAQ